MTQGLPYPGTSGPPPNPSSSNIYQQIEGTAGYYTPNVYELLTFYSSLVTQPDELDGQFIPLTDVPISNPNKTLIFAVGVLPPSSNVTGNLLDRSASLAQTMPIQGGINVNLQSAAGRSQVSSAGGGSVGGVGGRTTGGTPGPNGGPPVNLTYSVGQVGQAISDAYTNIYGHPPTLAELSIYVAQSLRETGTYGPKGNSCTWPNNNPGYIGNYYPTAGKTDENGIPDPQGLYHAGIPAGQPVFSFKQPNGSTDYYNTYQTPTAGATAFVKTIGRMGGVQYAQQGDFSGYLNQLHSQGYFTDSVSHYLGLAQDPTVVAQQLTTAGVTTLPGAPLNQVAGGDGSQAATGWQSTGSANASAAQQNISNTANTNLNQSNLGMQFLAAQQSMINNTIAAINRMQNTPPLKMLVNPTSFKVSYEKIISDGEWGRNGPIIEHWGDGQDKIDASGKLAAFYSIDATGTGPAGFSNGYAPGLTRIARQYSQSYQNFLSLWLLYKNNGGIWFGDFLSQVTDKTTSQPTNLSVVGSIYIYYDSTLYIGSFDSFNISETETAPYTLEYNFSFTVRATFLLDRVDSQLAYGAPPQLSSGQAPPNQSTLSPGVNPLQPNYTNAPLPTVNQLISRSIT